MYFYFIFKFVNQNFIDHLLGKSLRIFSYKFNDKIYNNRENLFFNLSIL